MKPQDVAIKLSLTLGRFQPTEAPRPPPATCAPYEATCKDGTCVAKVIGLKQGLKQSFHFSLHYNFNCSYGNEISFDFRPPFAMDKLTVRMDLMKSLAVRNKSLRWLRISNIIHKKVFKFHLTCNISYMNLKEIVVQIIVVNRMSFNVLME